MAKKKKRYSPNDITDINVDWGIDEKDTEKRPFSGASVQKFIKEMLSSLLSSTTINASDISSVLTRLITEETTARAAESAITKTVASQAEDIASLGVSVSVNTGNISNLSATQKSIASTLETIHDWYQRVVGSDTDEDIDRWDEVVKFVSGLDPGTTLDSLLNDIRTLLSEEVSRAKEAESGLSNNISTTNATINSLTKRVTTTEDDLSNIKPRLTSAEDNIKSITTRVETAETDLKNVTAQVSTNESNISRVTTRITTAEGDIDSLEGRTGTLEKSLDAVTTRITIAEDDIDSLQTRMDRAETSLASVTDRVTAIESTNVYLTQEEYEALVNSGKIEENKVYNIYEE